MVETTNLITIYAIGSVSSGKHLFFDTLNIHFREQETLYKVYSNEYSYKGKDYKYLIYFISGSFKDPGLLPSQRTMCDAVLLLVNPIIEGVFSYIEEIISKISEAHKDTLLALIMQNVFGGLDNLPPEVQEIAILNGADFVEIENKYNLKLISLNYDLDEIAALESGDPMTQFKFFKLFNEAFYDIIHECIERKENPEKKTPILNYEYKPEAEDEFF